jgi:hypothetical protein
MRKLFSASLSILQRQRSVLPLYFTREETLTIAKRFILTTSPLYIKNAGVWQAGGWYYFLWMDAKGEQKVILRSSHADLERNKYYVKHWDKHEMPSRQDVENAIATHAAGLQDATLEHGVVTKRGFIRGKKHIWCSYGFEVNFDINPGGKNSLFCDYMTTNRRRHDPLNKNRWMTRGMRGVDYPLPESDAPLEKIAELAVTPLFYDYITKRWEAPSLQTYIGKRDTHYWVAHFRRSASVFARRYTRSDNKPLQGFDALWEILSAFQGLSLIGTTKSVLGIGVDIVNISKRRAHETKPYPGSPDGSNPKIQAMTEDSKYIAPLNNFFRTAKESFLQEGIWLRQRDFGFEGLDPIYHHTVNDLIDVELLLIALPNRGSQIRFYAYKEPRSELSTENIGAIRIFRPDGLTLTFTKERLWIHYEPGRHVYRDPTPLISQELSNLLTDPEQFRVLTTKNLLSGHSGLEQADIEELNDQFNRDFDVHFVLPDPRSLRPYHQPSSGTVVPVA